MCMIFFDFQKCSSILLDFHRFSNILIDFQLMQDLQNKFLRYGPRTTMITMMTTMTMTTTIMMMKMIYDGSAIDVR